MVPRFEAEQVKPKYTVTLVESGDVARHERALADSEQPKEERIVPIATTSIWTVKSCCRGKSTIIGITRRDKWDSEADDQESRHCHDCDSH
jgi:hypothetical protein